MNKKLKLATLFCCLVTLALQAQEEWTLQRCIEYAQQNSLTIKSAEIDIRNAQLSEQSNKMARLPNLNASTRGRISFGRTINLTTNSFESESRTSQSLSLDAGLTLYNGQSISNSIKQSQYDVAAARADAEDISRDIALQVARAYLSILFSQEQLENALKSKQQTALQLDQISKLIQAGTRPQSERLDIEAQLARDEQAVITQQNEVAISYLNLKQLLELPPDYNLSIKIPDVSTPPDTQPETFTLKNVYAQALQNQPSIRAGELRLRSAEMAVDIAKANMLPTVSLFGSISTNWAAKTKDFTKPNTDNRQIVYVPQEARINGNDVQLEFPDEIGITYPNKTYFDQLNDNFGQLAGVSVSIPIFNNGRTSIAMERARLNIMNTEIINEQVKQTLKSEIQRAIADAQAAKKQLDAAERSVLALETAYQNAEKRFRLGAINTFEYTTSGNNLDQARVDFIVAKYDYIFKLKIVDYYLGKTIELD